MATYVPTITQAHTHLKTTNAYMSRMWSFWYLKHGHVCMPHKQMCKLLSANTHTYVKHNMCAYINYLLHATNVATMQLLVVATRTVLFIKF